MTGRVVVVVDVVDEVVVVVVVEVEEVDVVIVEDEVVGAGLAGSGSLASGPPR